MSRYDVQRPKKNPPHISLGDLRAISGKTLDQVCAEASEIRNKPVTKGHLSGVERGHRGASPDLLAALEVVYGLRPGALVTDYEPRQREAVA